MVRQLLYQIRPLTNPKRIRIGYAPDTSTEGYWAYLGNIAFE
jgi:hypothetical protein